MQNKNKKTDLVRSFAGIFYLIFLLLFIYIIGGIFYLYNQGSIDFPVQETNPDEYFSGCSLKYENCDKDCNLYILCGEEDYSVCRIYDCSDYFGIATKVGDSDYVFTREEKVDSEKVIERKNSCEGNVEILDVQCVDGKTTITSTVDTEGDCDVSKFMIDFEDFGMKSGSFSMSEDGSYLVTSNYCGDINEVIVVGSGGIMIDSKEL